MLLHFIQDPQFTFQIAFAAGSIDEVDDLTKRIEDECESSISRGWTGDHSVRFAWTSSTITAWYFADLDNTVILISVERQEALAARGIAVN